MGSRKTQISKKKYKHPKYLTKKNKIKINNNIRALTLFAARVLRSPHPSDERRPGIRVKAAAVWAASCGGWTRTAQKDKSARGHGQAPLRVTTFDKGPLM